MRSKFAEASAQTAAADLGAQWRAAEPFGPGTPSLGFTVGFGVASAAWTLDYGMAPMGELGNAQTFTLGARF